MSREDSRQLEELRFNYRRGSRQTATAYRLGVYAAVIRCQVTDFGAHSRRWIGLFRQGYADYCRQARRPASNSQGLT